ncbi:MAG: phage integrase SAM-like domain and Arm DNA-binding domain-containing protein, partial [Bacteroidota bacterium]|nr:phage integrase SAM-like domain and Arm DNA-binding domain-containing protein [Bacteroidota bacterium]
MSVKLRKKKISKGRFSLYLDIYENGKRKYDFLELYLEKSKPEESKENLAAAKKIRLAVEHQLAFSKRSVPNESQANTCFLKYIEVKYKGKGKKKDRFNSLIVHLIEFAGSDTIPFRIVTKQWLLNFQEYLSSGEERIANTVNAYM